MPTSTVSTISACGVRQKPQAMKEMGQARSAMSSRSSSGKCTAVLRDLLFASMDAYDSYCLKEGYGTRLIPEGTIRGAHFVKVVNDKVSYVQVTGQGDVSGKHCAVEQSLLISVDQVAHSRRRLRGRA